MLLQECFEVSVNIDVLGLSLLPPFVLNFVLQITNKARSRTWFFYCGQWLDKKSGLERTLQASDTDPRASLVTYTLTVHTSDVKGAGTDANVCCEMFGVKGSSGVRELKGKGNLFEQVGYRCSVSNWWLERVGMDTSI